MIIATRRGKWSAGGPPAGPQAARLRFFAVILFCCCPLFAEYRAFWVDTFNTRLSTHEDILAVISNAKLANANALFVQVRRRGDAWYLRSLEPLPDLATPIAPGFDPLDDLIREAQAQGIEVHAFVIIGAIWNQDPAVTRPSDPGHVFNLHGTFDSATWLTRTLLPDTPGAISHNGHRFGPEFWIDLGHPAAASYTLDVMMHLVRNYDIDGLHLDRIRYPELSVSGQTPSTGTSIGYNPTSVERFQKRHGIPLGSPPPAPNDPQWSQWRRDQVTNFVRRVYLNVMAEKPRVKVSAALITTGAGPTTDASWTSAEPYWRVYQDWRAWTEEGILDLAIPMDYKREHTASQAAQFDQWLEWTRTHQYNRGALLGLGAFLNAIEGTLRQTRRVLPAALGVIYFSMANPDVAVSPNPYSIPSNQSTPERGFAEFASALTSNRSVLYEPPADPVFAQPAAIPSLPWKTSSAHLMGFARRPDGTPIDAGTVTIENVVTGQTRNTITDGDGFFGAVGLAPGTYVVRVDLNSESYSYGPVIVIAGSVARLPLSDRRRLVRRGPG